MINIYKSLSIIPYLLVVLRIQTITAFTPSSTLSSVTSTTTSSATNPFHQGTSLLGKRKLSIEDDNDRDEQIQSCTTFLNKAVETKCEDPEQVLEALESLEKLMKAKRKQQDKTKQEVSQDVLDNLNGSWRLIFTTGTKQTQERFETKINYFPIKAVQSFDTSVTPFKIENGIYAGDFALLKFAGDFEFDLRKSKVEFNFDQISILQLPTINLKKDEAAKIGASTGLGSESNVKNAQKDKKAFFNWISADENIATARGGGGGIALWQRIVE